MSKAVKVPMYVENAVRITTDIEDFNGDVMGWKLSFYDIWRFQMTWDFAYEIKVHETRKGVRISILCKPDFKGDAVNMLEGFGCKNIKTEAEDVGIVDLLDVDNLMVNNVSAVIID